MTSLMTLFARNDTSQSRHLWMKPFAALDS